MTRKEYGQHCKYRAHYGNAQIVLEHMLHLLPVRIEVLRIEDLLFLLGYNLLDTLFGLRTAHQYDCDKPCRSERHPNQTVRNHVDALSPIALFTSYIVELNEMYGQSPKRTPK